MGGLPLLSLPRSAQRFLKQWGKGNNVKPFTFVLPSEKVMIKI